MNNNQKIAEGYLTRNGISNEKERKEILSGFDMESPVYENQIYPNDTIFQFVRNTDYANPFLNTGRWFCLAGATMDKLAIFSGGAGRLLTEFRVVAPITVLEGVANSLHYDWHWAGGGAGGATQLFIPKNLLYAVEAMGVHGF